MEITDRERKVIIGCIKYVLNNYDPTEAYKEELEELRKRFVK